MAGVTRDGDGKRSGPESFMILIALCAYILSSTALLPVCVSFLSLISGDHGISVLKQSEGISIVLSHGIKKDAGNPLSGTHHHNILSDAIVFFSNNTRETESDHILSFSVAPELFSRQHLEDRPEQLRPFSIHGDEFRAIDWTEAPILQRADYFEPVNVRLQTQTQVCARSECVEIAKCVVLLI